MLPTNGTFVAAPASTSRSVAVIEQDDDDDDDSFEGQLRAQKDIDLWRRIQYTVPERCARGVVQYRVLQLSCTTRTTTKNERNARRLSGENARMHEWCANNSNEPITGRRRINLLCIFT
jgi:hypothetical protein